VFCSCVFQTGPRTDASSHHKLEIILTLHIQHFNLYMIVNIRREMQERGKEGYVYRIISVFPHFTYIFSWRGIFNKNVSYITMQNIYGILVHTNHNDPRWWKNCSNKV